VEMKPRDPDERERGGWEFIHAPSRASLPVLRREGFSVEKKLERVSE
jgi:hypothetical protein